MFNAFLNTGGNERAGCTTFHSEDASGSKTELMNSSALILLIRIHVQSITKIMFSCKLDLCSEPVAVDSSFLNSSYWPPTIPIMLQL